MEKKYNVCKCVYSDIMLWILFFLPVLYGFVFYYSDNINMDENNMTSIFITYLIISAILFFCYIIFKFIYGIKNIKLSIKLAFKGNEEELLKYAKKAKYWSIWVYVVNFIINCFIALVLTVVSRGFILFSFYPLFIILVIAMTYLDVIFTSTFGIALIVYKRLNNKISKGFAILNIILLLCFVFDILDTFYLHFKFRKNKEV